MNCHRPYCFQSAEKPDEIIRADMRDTWRFFDNFVQAPEFTQSYNRYSYCLNNPLQWVDPSGEELFAPWYRDFVGFVHWIGSVDDMPNYGTLLGDEGVFTSDGEMRYYYADGRISNLKLPQVFINWGEPKDYSFYFSSFPLHGAGFYRIGDPSEQTGSLSSNFQFNTSNIYVGLISNYVGVTSSIYAEGNKGLNLYIPSGISGIVYGKQMYDIGKEAYNNWPPSIENYYDFTTANIGFWGGPLGAMIGFTLDLYKRGAKWLATYCSELEMELRRWNSPQTYY